MQRVARFRQRQLILVNKKQASSLYTKLVFIDTMTCTLIPDCMYVRLAVYRVAQKNLAVSQCESKR